MADFDKALELAKAATAETLSASCEAVFTALAEAEATAAETHKTLCALKAAVGVPLGILKKEFSEFLRANNLLAEQESVGTQLVKLALESGLELWHDPEGRAWTTLELGTHREHHPLRTKALRTHLAGLYYNSTGTAAHAQGIQDALGVLEAKAVFEEGEHPTFTRLAEVDGRIYLDLANEHWEVVEIAPGGWRILSSRASPVRFRRSRGMLPLPTPTVRGSLAPLAELLNLEPDTVTLVTQETEPLPPQKHKQVGRALRLTVAWLLQALRGKGPYPLAVLTGEQGSGKSTASRMLRALIDPNVSPVRTLSRDEGDLLIAATNAWTLAFDNTSSLSKWISDALCRLSTGGGLSKRELYSDSDEVLLDAQRPVLLNGITDVVSRQDLVDRALQIHLPPIPEEDRMPEAELWRRFEAVRPGILGALLDVVAAGLERLPHTKLERLPRLADFALWMTACEEPLGWQPGDFMAAYADAKEDLMRAALDDEPIVEPLLKLAEAKEVFEGTASELLTELARRAGLEDNKRKPEGWPKSATELGKTLARLAPALRKLKDENSMASGVAVTRLGRKGNKRGWRLENIGVSASQVSQVSPDAAKPVSDDTTPNDTYSTNDARRVTPSVMRHTPVTPQNASRTAKAGERDTYDVSDARLQPFSKDDASINLIVWDELVGATEGEL